MHGCTCACTRARAQAAATEEGERWQCGSSSPTGAGGYAPQEALKSSDQLVLASSPDLTLDEVDAVLSRLSSLAEDPGTEHEREAARGSHVSDVGAGEAGRAAASHSHTHLRQGEAMATRHGGSLSAALLAAARISGGDPDYYAPRHTPDKHRARCSDEQSCSPIAHWR